ncbi:MAG: hypothetical protein R3E32_00345 [Chitinophagales bacterium]
MNQQINKTNVPNTLAEKIEDAMGFRSKVQSISLGIKLGVLTAALTALYFFFFKMVSFDNYVLVHLSKFFIIGGIMAIGFILFKPRKEQPSFAQGVRLAGTITLAAAVSFLLLQVFLALIGSPAYFEPEMSGRAMVEGADNSMVAYMMFVISLLEVVIYGMIAGIASILYFTSPLKTSKRSSNVNETQESSYIQVPTVK